MSCLLFGMVLKLSAVIWIRLSFNQIHVSQISINLSNDSRPQLLLYPLSSYSIYPTTIHLYTYLFPYAI